MSPVTDDVDGLVRALVSLGDDLALDVDVVGEVLDRIDRRPSRHRRRRLLVAAAVLVVTSALVVAALPGSRQAVARWFGLDGVAVDVDPGLSLPEPELRLDAPGNGHTYVVDGRTIRVASVAGSLDLPLIRKVVTTTGEVAEVDVAGAPGLWFSAPHLVLYLAADGTVIEQAVAGSTLVFQDGGTVHRIEGFDDPDEAIEFATRP